MPRVRNGEIEIAYETFGTEGDPALILLHGLGSSMLVWHEDFCAGFVDRGFFVLRMDHRDSGLSTVMPDGSRYRLGDMARDAVAVLDSASCDRAIVCGRSLGGMVAQAAAVAFTAPPAAGERWPATGWCPSRRTPANRVWVIPLPRRWPRSPRPRGDG